MPSLRRRAPVIVSRTIWASTRARWTAGVVVAGTGSRRKNVLASQIHHTAANARKTARIVWWVGIEAHGRPLKVTMAATKTRVVEELEPPDRLRTAAGLRRSTEPEVEASSRIASIAAFAFVGR